MNKYPGDCIQNISNSPWWIKDTSQSICRGALIWTYVQFFDDVPYELTAERADPEKHGSAMFTIKSSSIRGGSAASTLPVAGMPKRGADCFLVYRVKCRPCLVIGSTYRPSINRMLIRGMSKNATTLFMHVAPFYGVEQAGRSGYNPEFVERIKHAEYPQFFWDILPDDSAGHGSILRLDHMQPVGETVQTYEHSGYKLGADAIKIIDEWLAWIIYDKNGEEISTFRDLMRDISPK